MDTKDLEELLKQVQGGRIEIDAALHKLKKLPFEDLGFAKVDNHRCVRSGVPEVIYCEGKTVDQIQGIVTKIAEYHPNIMGTRADRNVYEGIKRVLPDTRYYETARIVVANPKPLDMIGNLAVVCAGTSDLPVAEEAAVTAEVLGNHVIRLYDVGVAGIHRLLEHCDELMQANVVVVVAGMEGALASVVGGLVSCPVIAVPTSVGYGASFGGLSALVFRWSTSTTVSVPAIRPA